MSFLSEGTQCAATLYRPTDAKNPPIVVMAHGFGLLRRFRLPDVAPLHRASDGTGLWSSNDAGGTTKSRSKIHAARALLHTHLG